jgi:hypothetical protein
MRSPLLRRVVLGCFVLFSLTVAAFWVRSYWVVDTFSWSSTSEDHLLASGGGRLVYADANWPNRRVAVTLRHDRTARAAAMWFERPAHTDGFRIMGFEYSASILPYNTGTIYLSFYLPPWRLIAIPYGGVLALSLLPLLSVPGGWARRKRRRKRGLCVRCGYDLRASVGRCPECGGSVQVGG